jgi:hypothetical protein
VKDIVASGTAFPARAILLPEDHSGNTVSNPLAGAVFRLQKFPASLRICFQAGFQTEVLDRFEKQGRAMAQIALGCPTTVFG